MATKNATATKAGKAFEHDPRVPHPGTTLRRLYKGKVYEVKVLADGFDFKGDHYPSLSAIAVKITKLQTCDGFLWWGIKQRGRDVDTVAKEYKDAATHYNAMADELGLSTIAADLTPVLTHTRVNDIKAISSAASRMRSDAKALDNAAKLAAVRVGRPARVPQ